MNAESEDKAQGEPRTPRWATQRFRDFLDFMASLGGVVHLTIRGISGIQAMPKLVSALALADGVADTEFMKTELEHATKLANLAEREVEDGFPPVQHGLLSLFGDPLKHSSEPLWPAGSGIRLAF